MTRALRRHQAQVHMRRRLRERAPFSPVCNIPRELGRLREQPQWCSCTVCGNPRRWFGERTIQERRAEDVT